MTVLQEQNCSKDYALQRERNGAVRECNTFSYCELHSSYRTGEEKGPFTLQSLYGPPVPRTTLLSVIPFRGPKINLKADLDPAWYKGPILSSFSLHLWQHSKTFIYRPHSKI